MADFQLVPGVEVTGTFTRTYRAEINMDQLQAMIRKALNVPDNAAVDIDDIYGAAVTWSVTESIDG